jgi:hypothetical protein
MFAFILLFTGFFFDYQQETTQRRYTGFLLILVSAFKGASHIIIEIKDSKTDALDIMALQLFSIYWIFFKLYFFVQIIILSKWFSRVYFPLIGAFFLTSKNVAFLL